MCSCRPRGRTSRTCPVSLTPITRDPPLVVRPTNLFETAVNIRQPFLHFEKGIQMFKLQEENFYVLSETSAKEFDAELEDQQKRFAALLPGSNAYLLNDADCDPLSEDIDADEAESG